MDEPIKNIAWAVFVDEYGFGDFLFHSAHWNRERARFFAKEFAKESPRVTKVKKIEYEIVPK